MSIDPKTPHVMRRAVPGDTRCADCGMTRGTVAHKAGAAAPVDVPAPVADAAPATVAPVAEVPATVPADQGDAPAVATRPTRAPRKRRPAVAPATVPADQGDQVPAPVADAAPAPATRPTRAPRKRRPAVPAPVATSAPRPAPATRATFHESIERRGFFRPDGAYTAPAGRRDDLSPHMWEMWARSADARQCAGEWRVTVPAVHVADTGAQIDDLERYSARGIMRRLPQFMDIIETLVDAGNLVDAAHVAHTMTREALMLSRMADMPGDYPWHRFVAPGADGRPARPVDQGDASDQGSTPAPVDAPAVDQVATVPAPAPAAPRTARKPRTVRPVPAQTTKDVDMSLSPAVARLVATVRPVRPAGAPSATVRPADLVKGLKFATTAVPRKPSMPALAMTLIEIDAAAGTVRLATSDFDRFHVASVDLVDGAPATAGRLIVPTGALTQWLTGQKAATVDLWLTGTALVVTAGAGTLTLPTGPVEDYPALPALPPAIGTVPAGALVDAVKRAYATASRDQVLPMVCATVIDTDGAAMHIESTDRYRMGLSALTWSPVDQGAAHRVAVPARDLVDAVKVIGDQGDTVTVGATGDVHGWASVSAGGYVAIIRQSSSAMDKGVLRKIITRPTVATFTVPAGALVDAVKSATAGQEKVDRVGSKSVIRGVELSATAGALVVRFRDAVVTVAGALVDGADEVATAIDPAFIAPMVTDLVGSVKGKAGPSKTVTFDVAAAGKPVIVTGDAAGYRYAFQPIRITGDAAPADQGDQVDAPAAPVATVPAAPVDRPSHPFTGRPGDKRCTVAECGKGKRAGIHFGTPVVLTDDAAPATVDQVDAVTVDAPAAPVATVPAAPVEAAPATVDQVDAVTVDQVDAAPATVPATDAAPVARTVTADPETGDQVDAAALATVRAAIAGATWSHGSGFIGKGAHRRKFTGTVCAPATTGGFMPRPVWRVLAAQLSACGAGAYIPRTGFATESGSAGNPWSGRTWSTRERVAAWLAATADQVDAPAAPVEAAPATVDQVDAVTVDAPATVPADQVDAPRVTVAGIVNVTGLAETGDQVDRFATVHAYVKASNATGCDMPAHPLPAGHGMFAPPADIYGAYTVPASGRFVSDLVTCDGCRGALIAGALAPYAAEIAGCACTACTAFATAVGTGDMPAIIATGRVLTLSLRRGAHIRYTVPAAPVEAAPVEAAPAPATVDQVDAVTVDAPAAPVEAAPATVDQVDAVTVDAPATVPAPAPVRVTLVAVDTVDAPAAPVEAAPATVDQVDAVDTDAPADLVATLSVPATVTVSGAGDFAGRTVTVDAPARPIAKAVRSALGTARATVGGTFSVVAPAGSRVMGIAFTSDTGSADWSAVLDIVAGIVAEHGANITPVAAPATV